MSTNRPNPDAYGIKCSCQGFNLDKFLQPNILTLLLQQDLHGYMIIQELNKMELFKGEKIDRAGIYRTLKNMEEKGLLSSEWDIKDLGATKRIYKITRSGKACLASWVQTLEAYTQMIETIIEDAKTGLNKDRTASSAL